jgi:hypothetical protein
MLNGFLKRELLRFSYITPLKKVDIKDSYWLKKSYQPRYRYKVLKGIIVFNVFTFIY